MALVDLLTNKYRRTLKKDIAMARYDTTPEKIVKTALNNCVPFSAAMSYLVWSFWEPAQNLFVLTLLFLGGVFVFFNYGLLAMKPKIKARRLEMERDVLFAGRYLMVKLNSGKPLMNALIEAANSYGNAEKYFGEIVKDIDMGKPIEDALSLEAENNPSPHFRKILFQISNALKIGIDVTEFLDATLAEIAEAKILEIQKYGKKLNSMTLFYMLVGIIVPSLGMTMFVIVAGLSGMDIGLMFFAIATGAVIVIQSFFLMIYRGIKPNINL